MSDRNLYFLAVKAFVIAVVCLCASYMFFILGPTAESNWYPVVEKLQITEITPGPEVDTSMVYARFNKVRDCEFIGISWNRLVTNGAVQRVPVILQRRDGDDSSPNRRLGVSVAGPWIVSMPASQIRGQSVVEVYHRCHPFWTTRTPFYP